MKNKTKVAQDEILKGIERIGDYHFKDVLSQKDPALLKKNAQQANWEFINTFFYRGRRDEISFRFAEAGKLLVERYFGDQYEKRLSSFDEANFITFLEEEKLEIPADYNDRYEKTFDTSTDNKFKLELANKYDKQMLVSALSFLNSIYKETGDPNILKYCLKEINSGNIPALYRKLLSIYYVGPKLAGLYLRELKFLLPKEIDIPKNQLHKFFPVDTWVRQIAPFIGITDYDNDKQLIESIYELCNRKHIDFLKFNAGAWYLGSNPMRIFFKYGLIKQVKMLNETS